MIALFQLNVFVSKTHTSKNKLSPHVVKTYLKFIYNFEFLTPSYLKYTYTHGFHYNLNGISNNT